MVTTWLFPKGRVSGGDDPRPFPKEVQAVTTLWPFPKGMVRGGRVEGPGEGKQ